ncbi:MAG: TaqI-like C-terminal specificity domain-containing protein [bacterium]
MATVLLAPSALPPIDPRHDLLNAIAAWQLSQGRIPVDRHQLALFPATESTAQLPLLPAGLQRALGATDPRTLGAALERYHDDQRARMSRKQAGAFYTPPRLVDEVIDAALVALDYLPTEPLRVCEPSCGFGAFAVAMAATAHDRQWDLRLALRDLEPHAAEVAAALCRLAAPAEHLELDVAPYDFLLSDDSPDQPYDLIIGNPPFVASYARDSHGFTDTHKKALRKRYRFASGRINTAVLFLERGLQWLRPGGVLALVLPSALFHLQSWAALRRWLLDEHTLHLARYCGEWAFRADVPTGVLVVQKGRSAEHQGHRLFATGEPPVTIVRDAGPGRAARRAVAPATAFRQFPHTILTPAVEPRIRALLDTMERDSVPLGEIVEIRDGINCANLKQHLVHDTARTPEHRRVLIGRDVTPWRIEWSGSWIWYDPSAIARESEAGGYGFLREEWIFKASPKLVHRQTADRLIAAVDTDQHYALNSCHCTIPKVRLPLGDGPGLLHDWALAPLTDPWLLCALYNSFALNTYYQLVFCEVEQTFPQVKTANIRLLPVPRALLEVAGTLALEARDLAEMAGPWPNVAGRARLDDRITSAYGLAPEALAGLGPRPQA